MKILITAPEIGGPATYARLLQDTFPKYGVDIEIVSFGVVKKYPRFVRTFVYFLKLVQLSREVDIVFAQDPVSTGLPALFAARWNKAHFVLRVAGDYAWEQAYQRFGVREDINTFQNKRYGIRTETLRSIQRYVTRRAACVITPSNYFADVVRSWGVEPTVIYNGINLGVEAKTPSQQVPDKSIVSVGRLVPWKGFRTTIELLEILNDWTLFVIGEGDEHGTLHAHAKSLGVENRVQFVGEVTREELYGFFQAADVLVLNTSFESFSFLVAEAMDAGIPIVAGKVGSIPELLRDGVDGLLITPNDKQELKVAVERVYNDDDLRASIIASAQERVRKYTIDKTVKRLKVLIETICV